MTVLNCVPVVSVGTSVGDASFIESPLVASLVMLVTND